jgi:hypothetical protein
MTSSFAKLQAAYEAAAYRVHGSPVGAFVIRCGEVSPALDALLAIAGADTWAFVTAANPGSLRLDDATNRRRHAALVAEVRRRGFVCYAGAGAGDDGAWPPEESVLVPGLDEASAIALGRAFGQFAVLVGERCGPARLAWAVVQVGLGTGRRNGAG